jgi:tetratricopeptide (TPR) repeat protein
MNDLATVLTSQGRFDEAERHYREALEVFGRTLPKDHPKLGETLVNLGLLLDRQGRLEESEALTRQGLDLFRKSLDHDAPDLASALNNYGMLLHRQGKLDEAEPLFREALAIVRRIPGYPFAAHVLSNLASLLLDQGRAAEAEPLYRESIDALQRLGSPERWKFGIAREGLGRSLTELQRREEAETQLLEAEWILAPGHPLAPRRFHRRCVAGLVRLYDDWERAEPGKGYGARADEWRTRLESLPAEP